MLENPVLYHGECAVQDPSQLFAMLVLSCEVHDRSKPLALKSQNVSFGWVRRSA